MKNGYLDPDLRISRKKITGTNLEIFQRDIFNEGPELDAHADKPNMNLSLMGTTLGFFQAKFHDYVYIISRKHASSSNSSTSGGSTAPSRMDTMEG